MTDFAAITDWVDYLRDCLRDPAPHRELDPDQLEVDAGLSKVRGELKGTPYAARMSDAALSLLANGSADEAGHLLQISLDGAPSLGARVAAIARAWQGGPLDDRITTLLLRGLEAAPDDANVLTALDEQARRDGAHAIAALDLAMPHNASWVASHVHLLDASIDPSGERMAFLAMRTLPADLPRLADGIASAGKDYVARFTTALAKSPKHVVDRLRPVLASKLAYAGRVP
jgi:hypothetical protein